ncbi:carbohydrate ABC transporter permease [Lentibacillus amyloliquefaciens]|uniref:ABC transporter permease n=1 Tax=Lentibacillus amyloliquefaciens TaxID=1472767 RepID=A0A0U4FHX0_9BACI|nr:carbohydrate ABC transporter permease [Lentibacillus amyloliquefaciens]ALX50125.1 ABC transporter permease [Lentibacillus amyloliquefaciens]
MQHKQTMLKIGLYSSYVFVTLLFLFPLLWVLSLSFKTSQELYNVPPNLFPESLQFDNYKHVIENNNILSFLLNSLQIVSLTVILTLIIVLPAAFALSRYKFKLKGTLLLGIILTQMISAVVISIPLYRLFAEWGLLNNFFMMVIVYVAVVLPFSTWFLKGYFDTIPIELDEAATVDGCNKFQILTRILLPSSMPGIVSVTLLIAVQSWSQFVIPFILLDIQSSYPVSVGIVNLQSTQQAITTHYLAAGSVISILPVIVLFVLLQRFIVGALTTGAVKG